MREIKFRGLHNGEWVYGSYTHVTDMESGKPSIIPFGTNIFLDVEPESVGEFTGLYDKSTQPKEIYEGDIIDLEPMEDDSDQSICRCVVAWNKGCDGCLRFNGFYAYPIYSKWYGESYIDGESYGKILGISDFLTTVIGNVSQNPNLLEQNK